MVVVKIYSFSFANRQTFDKILYLLLIRHAEACHLLSQEKADIVQVLERWQISHLSAKQELICVIPVSKELWNSFAEKQKRSETEFWPPPRFCQFVGRMVRARPHRSNVFFQPLPFFACFSPENAYLKIFHFFQIRKFYEKRVIFPNSFLFVRAVHPSSP